MKYKSGKIIALTTLAAALMLAGGCGQKDTAGQPAAPKSAEWPAQNITLIVPFKPGGGFDIVARATAPIIEKNLPQKANVVVQNVPGAGGKIGFTELYKAKADGYTVAVLDPKDVAVLQVGGQLEEMDIRKVSWLGRLDSLPDMLVVGAKSGFKSPADMKGKPVRFAGVGPANTFRAAVIARGLGAEPQFVNYDAVSEAYLAAMRGEIDAVVNNWPTSMRQVDAGEGKLLPLFVAAAERVPQIKDVPTAQEVGINLELDVMGQTHTIAAPPGLTSEVRRAWEETMTRVFNDPEWAAQMEKANFPTAALTGEDKINPVISATYDSAEKVKDLAVSVSGK